MSVNLIIVQKVIISKSQHFPGTFKETQEDGLLALKSLEDSLSQHILQPLFTEMDISTSEREESTPKKLGKIINKKWKKKN